MAAENTSPSHQAALPEYCTCSVLVLGCGNILFGDDGFGPAVADYLSDRGSLPGDVCVLNLGTSVRPILFDLVLSEVRPQKIVIVDAVDASREPGELFDLEIDSLPEVKIDDFSMHQLPTSNLLRELRDLCGVEVRILVCQIGDIPGEVAPGLSIPVEQAVARAADLLAREHFSPQ